MQENQNNQAIEKQEYITIKQLADILGLTSQAIYQQVDKRLKDYLVVVNNQKMLKKSVLKDVYNINSMTKKVDIELNKELQNQRDELNKQLDNLHKQLEAKSKAILLLKKQNQDKAEEYNVNIQALNSEHKTEIAEIKAELNRLLDSKEEIIGLLRAELEQKNAEINRLQDILENQQKLTLVTQQRIDRLEAAEQEINQAAEQESTKKKWRFFK